MQGEVLPSYVLHSHGGPLHCPKRRHMRVISYLGMLDKLFGVPVTTRNWKTISSVIKVLQDTE